MSNAITARLGLDAGPFRKGLGDATKELSAASQRMAQSHNARGAAAEGVWEREKKVENQMVSLAGKLTTATSASDAMTASFSALAESINLPLAGGIAAGAGIAIADSLNKASEKAEELRANLGRAIAAANMSEAADGVAHIHSGLEGIAASLKEITKEQGFWAKFSEGFNDMSAESEAETGEGKRAKLIEQALEARKRLWGEVAEAQKQVADIQEMILQGDDEGAALAKVRLEFAQRIATVQRDAGKFGGSLQDVQGVVDQIAREQMAAEEKVRKDASEKRGKAVDENMAAVAKEFRERKKMEEDAADAGLELNRNMANEAERFRQKQAEEGLALDKHMAEEALKFKLQKASELAQKEKDLQDERADKASAKAQAAAAKTKAAVQQRVQDLKDGPEAVRARRREERRNAHLAARAEREEALSARGGKSEREGQTGMDLLKQGPQEPPLQREARLRRQRAEEARRGLSKGRQDESGKELTSAMDATKMSASIQNIEKNLKVNTK